MIKPSARPTGKFEMHPSFMNMKNLIINFIVHFLQMAVCTRHQDLLFISFGDQAGLPVNFSERQGPK